MSTPAIDLIVKIQTLLNEAGYTSVKPDGDIGRITLAAIAELDEAGDREAAALSDSPTDKYHTHTGKASFFAGPQDVAAFRRCKATGKTDMQCFAVGDNGVGKWGHDCTSEGQPMAAVPREIWRNAGKSGGARLAVTYQGKRVEGILGDTMPSLENIHNGAVIDLNPGFAVAFGIAPSDMNNHTLSPVTWTWL